MVEDLKIVPGLLVQKDGTYALTIELPNGILKARVLEVLAEISKGPDIRLHITVAQKIMLLGFNHEAGIEAMKKLEAAGAVVRKARDLSHPRVCVGRPYCKLAFQDTFAMGEYLYEKLARQVTPPKLKIGVSGCPACCSWANVMDFGLVGQRSGYKVLIGGHGGARPRTGQEIATISSEQEAAQILGRLARLFSREIKRKARVDRLIKKLGIERVKREILDAH